MAPAFAAQLSVRVSVASGDFQAQALGWRISMLEGREVALHTGRTTGFRSFIGIAPEAGLGVVVLGNIASRRAGEDIGLHILTGKRVEPVVRPEAVTAEASALHPLTGHFQISPELTIEVRIEGDRLVFDPPGPGHVFYPVTATRFFRKHFDVEVNFELGADGRAVALSIRQNGRDMRAGRVG